MRKYLAFALLVVASIEIGRHLPSGADLSLILGCITCAVLGVLAKDNKYVRRAFLVTAALLLFAVRSNQILLDRYPDIGVFSGHDVKLEATVSEDPRSGEETTSVVLDSVVLSENSFHQFSGKLITRVPSFTEIRYGDRIEIEGRVSDLSSIKDEGYRNYLFFHQIYGQVEWPRITIIERDKGNLLIASGISLQQSANEKIKQLLPRDAASFLSGVVLGARQPISEDFSDALKITGTNHLLVASGYNISVLISFMLNIKKYLSKNTSLILVIIMIACYMFISGLDPSIIRASIMASLALIATRVGRQKHAIYLMILSGSIMLIINPSWIYDVGFQLSFAATFGIISLQQYLYQKMCTLPKFLREMCSTTLAAQVFVYPILIVNFGQISVISLITNLMVSWIIPVIMFGGIALILLSFILPPLTHALAVVIYPMLWYAKICIQLSSKIPNAAVSIPNLGWTIAVGYYGLIYYIYQVRRLRETAI